MASNYLSRDGDVLDDIAFRQYGACNADTLAAVLAANPGLAARGVVLPAGVTIVLPDGAPIAPPASEGVSLWN